MSSYDDKTRSQRKRNIHARQELEAIRVAAVKRVLAGESPALVVRELGFHRSCIYDWLKIHKQHGEAGLRTRPISGRPARGRNTKNSVNLAGNPPNKATAPPAYSNIDGWVQLLYESLLDLQAPLNSFLSALNVCLDSITIIIPNLDTPSSPMRAFYDGSNLRETITQNKLLTDAWHANPFLNALSKPGDMFTLEEIVSPQDWQENDFCRSLQQRTSLRRIPVLGFCFAGPDKMRCGLFAFNVSGNRAFSTRDKQLLQRLRTHLETAVKLAIEHWRSSYTAKALGEAIDNLEIAALVLDGNGRVIESSGSAREMFRQKTGLSLRNQRIAFHDHGRQTQFTQAVAAAIAWRREPLGNKPVEAMRFTDPSGDAIGVLVQPITPPSMAIPYSITVSPHVIVYISDPAKPRPSPQHQLIIRLFNLSPREAHLTTLLTEGHSLPEAAKAMGITQATARTYLQHIYEKVGVHRRQDLVQRVMKSVAVLV